VNNITQSKELALDRLSDSEYEGGLSDTGSKGNISDNGPDEEFLIPLVGIGLLEIPFIRIFFTIYTLYSHRYYIKAI
jgi:hypothetical protein